MPEPSEDAIEMDDEGKPLAGVKAKQAAVDYLKSVLEQVSFLSFSTLFWWPVHRFPITLGRRLLRFSNQ